jgi:hypothetical protein
MSKSIKEFNQILQENYGYNLVALPTSGLKPLQVLYKKQEGIIGWIKHLFHDMELSNSNSELNEFIVSKRHSFPQVIENKVDSDLKNSFSENLQSEAKIDVVLKALGSNLLSDGEKNKLKVLLKETNNAAFELGGDAKEITINHRALDSFVTGANVHEDLGDTFRKRLKGSDLYIVTSVLMSNSFTLTSQNEATQSMNASFSEVKEIVEGSTKMKVQTKENSSIQFEGKEPIVFAFKAVQLKWDRNEFNEPAFMVQDKNGLVVKSANKLPLNYLKMDFEDNFLF